MRIHVLSDLHTEFAGWTPSRQAVEAADVIVLAGDIGKHLHGFEWARTAFEGRIIVYVAGNHEFYGAHLHGLTAEMRKLARELGIIYLDNNESVIDGVRFLGTTLWTDFELFGTESVFHAIHAAKNCMNDFRLIRYGSTGRFLPEQSVILHRTARTWLKGRLREPFAGKTVVVTHHAPSMRSIADRYKDDALSAAFASRLDSLVAGADMWIHGHTHAFADYEIEGCRVICNPRGYVEEKTGWDRELIVEV